MEPLPEAQMVKVKAAISIYGNAADMTITTKQLGPVLRALDTNPTERELADFIASADPTGTGTLDMNQFIPIYKRKLNDTDTNAELIEAFTVLDRDRNGHISVPEFRYFMVRLGEQLSEEDVDKLIAVADPGKTGFVDYQVFAKTLLPPREAI
jgi:calmodulin